MEQLVADRPRALRVGRGLDADAHSVARAASRDRRSKRSGDRVRRAGQPRRAKAGLQARRQRRIRPRARVSLRRRHRRRDQRREGRVERGPRPDRGGEPLPGRNGVVHRRARRRQRRSPVPVSSWATGRTEGNARLLSATEGGDRVGYPAAACCSPSTSATRSWATTRALSAAGSWTRSAARRAARGQARPAPLGDGVRRRCRGDQLHAAPADARRRPRGRVAGHLGPGGVLPGHEDDPQRAAGKPGGPRRGAARDLRATTTGERRGARRTSTTSSSSTTRSPCAMIEHVRDARAPLDLALPHRPLGAEPRRASTSSRRGRDATTRAIFHRPRVRADGRRVCRPATSGRPRSTRWRRRTWRSRPRTRAYIVDQFGIDVDRPLLTQVSRFDPWKDPLGVIDAYRARAARSVPTSSWRSSARWRTTIPRAGTSTTRPSRTPAATPTSTSSRT